MEPSVSATWTASGMFAGALKAALLRGLVSETLGGEFTITATGAEVVLAPRLSAAGLVNLTATATDNRGASNTTAPVAALVHSPPSGSPTRPPRTPASKPPD